MYAGEQHPVACPPEKVRYDAIVYGSAGFSMLNTCSPSSYAETKTYGHRTSWLCARSRQSAVQAPIGCEMVTTRWSRPGWRSKIRSGAYWTSVSVTAYRPSGVGVIVCP